MSRINSLTLSTSGRNEYKPLLGSSSSPLSGSILRLPSSVFQLPDWRLSPELLTYGQGGVGGDGGCSGGITGWGSDVCDGGEMVVVLIVMVVMVVVVVMVKVVTVGTLLPTTPPTSGLYSQPVVRSGTQRLTPAW